MTKKAEKLLERMRRTKHGWKRTDLYRLYEGFGFIIRVNKGKHDSVFHPDFPQLFTQIPRHQKVGEYNIRNAINMIDTLNRLRHTIEGDKSKGEQDEE